VLLGVIEGSPFYVSAAQFPYWANSQLTIDVVSDGGDSFSLEAAEAYGSSPARACSPTRDGCAGRRRPATGWP
jgi:uncharacterized protein (DUF779 family)